MGGSDGPRRGGEGVDPSRGRFRSYLLTAFRNFTNNEWQRSKAKKRGGPVVAPALAAFRSVADSIGLMGMATADFLEEVKRKRLAALGLEREAIEAAVAQRVKLREAKQWAEADAIRERLDGQGIVIMDGPEGSRWRVNL